MPDLLFNRDFAVTMQADVPGKALRIAARPQGGTQARPTLRVQFKIEKNTAREPNRAEVVITNLSDKSRSAIQEKDALTIIEAGYVNNLFKLFQGALTFANHTRQGADWITRFEVGDGSKQYRQGRINESFGPGTSIEQVLNTTIDKIGVGVGNAIEKVKEGNFRGGLTEYTKGFTASGRAIDVLGETLESQGFTYSIQDGQLQVLREGEVVKGQVPVLRQGSGLIGSPEVGEKGVVKARALIQGFLLPGVGIRIESKEIQGDYKIQRSVFTGDTWGTDWYADLEAKPL